METRTNLPERVLRKPREDDPPPKSAAIGNMGVQPRDVMRACALGCDVRPGSWDVAIGEAWKFPGNPKVSLKLVFYGKVQDEKDVEFLANQYPVSGGIIDSRPEASLALRFVKKMRKAGKDFWRAQYNTNPSQVDVSPNEKERIVTLQRSMTMDQVLHDFQSGMIVIPQNYREVLRTKGAYGEFVSELLSPTRVNTEWRGLPDIRWTENEADHAYHAINYMVAAAQICKLHVPRGDCMMPVRGVVKGTIGSEMDEPGNVFSLEDDGVAESRGLIFEL